MAAGDVRARGGFAKRGGAARRRSSKPQGPNNAVPKKAEVRLGWTTIGKGTTDSKIVDRLVFKQAQATDLRTFELTAPAEPYPFSGKLVSLVWNVELVLQPEDLRERHEIVIAPNGHEVLLPGAADS